MKTLRPVGFIGAFYFINIMKQNLKAIRLKKSYENLLFNLINDFGIQKIKIVDGIIMVHYSTGLHDYDQYAFYNKTIQSMSITKYIKKFNNKFFAQFENYQWMQVVYLWD